MTKAFCILPALALTLTLVTGCRIDEHKNGNDKDVKIDTPFGGMSVKTNESAVTEGVGLTVYPGAVLDKKKEDGKNDGAADINLHFGSFHLGVKAATYRTADAPDKVMAFYRKDMAKYGAVILCHGNNAVGKPDHTQDGLSCASDHNTRINVEDDKAENQLKAGSKQHQHIVAINPDGAGTKIGLVALDLPSQLDSSDKDDKD